MLMACLRDTPPLLSTQVPPWRSIHVKCVHSRTSTHLGPQRSRGQCDIDRRSRRSGKSQNSDHSRVLVSPRHSIRRRCFCCCCCCWEASAVAAAAARFFIKPHRMFGCELASASRLDTLPDLSQHVPPPWLAHAKWVHLELRAQCSSHSCALHASWAKWRFSKSQLYDHCTSSLPPDWPPASQCIPMVYSNTHWSH